MMFVGDGNDPEDQHLGSDHLALHEGRDDHAGENDQEYGAIAH